MALLVPWVSDQLDVVPPTPARVAIVIGLDGRVPGSSTDDIHGAEAAATGVADALRAQGFQVQLLVGDQADREALQNAWSATESLLKPEDLALVYLVTHGATCPGRDDKVAQHLRLSDTRVSEDHLCWEGGVTDAELLSWMSGDGDAKGGRILVIDACRSPEGVLSTLGAAHEPARHPWSRTWRRMLVLRSTSGTMPAYSDGLGLPLYSSFFIQGLGPSLPADLDQDGAVTGLEAHDYATLKLLDFLQENDARATSGMQVPMRTDEVIGAARELVLAGQVGPPRVTMIEGGVFDGFGVYFLGDHLSSMGPSGRLPADGGGPLTLRMPDERLPRLRVYGTEWGLDHTDIGAWHPGRVRGHNALIAGVAWSDRQLVPGEGSSTPDKFEELLAQWSEPTPQLALRLHAPVLANAAIDLSVWGPLAQAPGDAWEVGVALAPGAELNWRRWSLRAAPRVEGAALILPYQGEGEHAIDSAREVPARGILSLGAEAGLRVGLTRTLALGTHASWSNGVALGSGVVPDDLRRSVELGLMWDPYALGRR